MVLDKFMFCSISSLKDSPSLIGESSKYNATNLYFQLRILMSIPKYMKYTNLCIPQMLLFFYSRFKYTNLGRFRSSYFSCNHQVFIS
ncbi:calmodulin-binding transcription activator 1 isoform X1 [Iris pallida]|uniref:Calmodulin-binding transcription activator 1 isoform X1 n=1 Tax=Iris pallida TaxID=29817 RepID=A0AAX6ECP3_IRIPA|nr:calmodulin-binding transcription activator 1 isoform X1 [Iris pallida]